MACISAETVPGVFGCQLGRSAPASPGPEQAQVPIPIAWSKLPTVLNASQLIVPGAAPHYSRFRLVLRSVHVWKRRVLGAQGERGLTAMATPCTQHRNFQIFCNSAAGYSGVSLGLGAKPRRHPRAAAPSPWGRRCFCPLQNLIRRACSLVRCA